MFSEEKRRKIKRDYKKLKSYKKCAEKNDISVYMVKKVLTESVKKEERKGKSKSEMNSSEYEYMEKKRIDALNFIGKCLDTMSSEEKLTNAPINQIASAMGVVMDKFASKDDGEGRLDEILKAVGKLE